MMEVTGKFNTDKIYTDVVDEASISQVKDICDDEISCREYVIRRFGGMNGE